MHNARDRFERVECNDWRGKIECGFRRIQSDTTVRQNMGRMFWWLATRVMVNILRAESLIQGDNMRGIDLKG